MTQGLITQIPGNYWKLEANFTSQLHKFKSITCVPSVVRQVFWPYGFDQWWMQEVQEMKHRNKFSGFEFIWEVSHTHISLLSLEALGKVHQNGTPTQSQYMDLCCRRKKKVLCTLHCDVQQFITNTTLSMLLCCPQYNVMTYSFIYFHMFSLHTSSQDLNLNLQLHRVEMSRCWIFCIFAHTHVFY